MNRKSAEDNNASYLVESDWLQQRLDLPSLRVFDCTVRVTQNTDPLLKSTIPFTYQSDRAHFETAHIPRAGYIDIPGELSDTTAELPLVLPSEQQFVEMMSRYGVGDNTQVVLYSTTEPNWAARVWWLLRSFGFNNASILNGGWNKWVAEGRPVSKQACSYAPAEFIPRPRSGAFVEKHDVLAAINDNEVSIINALPSPIHTGSSEVAFGRKGRISGSVNVPFDSLHDSQTGVYLSVEQLRRKFEAVGAADVKRIITYCGGGIAAANNAFALTLLGYDNVAVYDGSLLEWGNDATLPMEMG